ncbi:MAG: hypothetical protein QOF69_3424, partial [Solirubrobacteraceae bacterium]|nr:hypothetical protein [Solirubrobacteraceae bacterium]
IVRRSNHFYVKLEIVSKPISH